MKENVIFQMAGAPLTGVNPKRATRSVPVKTYNFFVRLFILFPFVLICGVLWAFISLISYRSLGEVLKETGENILSHKK